MSTEMIHREENGSFAHKDTLYMLGGMALVLVRT
jgi:hypothetical protein